MTGDFRIRRVENLLRDEISSLILSGQLKDPRIDKSISITRITLSKDLCYAKIHISTYKNRNILKKATEALNHAAGFVQAKISRRLKLKTTPRLRFIEDHAIEESFELVQKMKEIHH